MFEEIKEEPTIEKNQQQIADKSNLFCIGSKNKITLSFRNISEFL
jgi:hypothetical protein